MSVGLGSQTKGSPLNSEIPSSSKTRSGYRFVACLNVRTRVAGERSSGCINQRRAVARSATGRPTHLFSLQTHLLSFGPHIIPWEPQKVVPDFAAMRQAPGIALSSKQTNKQANTVESCTRNICIYEDVSCFCYTYSKMFCCASTVNQVL